jgi:glutamate-5-semialdehyde dehydrogenase
MTPQAHLEQVVSAAALLRASAGEKRSKVLLALAARLKAREREVLAANGRDLARLGAETTAAFRDRLLLNEARLGLMGESLRQVAALPDPLGEGEPARRLANGLILKRVRSPLGVILMIFESRPNVAVESFALAFKSGNAICLRGGKESMETTGELYTCMREALGAEGFPPDSFWGITDPDRALVRELLQARRYIDVVVPRGGDSLIEYVVENSRIPIIKNDRGMCHVFVNEDADPEMALAIVENAKTQRPGVCNAMETVLVHQKLAPSFLPALLARLRPRGVRWHGCPETCRILVGRPEVQPAEPKSWDTEYLDLIMNCRVVGSLDEAISHIEAHGSRHSESILTRSEPAARAFQARVDAAAVYWNASTRFTDGFEMGLGGELGISTQKLHVRGPVGLQELTSLRWVIDGTGQVRG